PSWARTNSSPISRWNGECATDSSNPLSRVSLIGLPEVSLPAVVAHWCTFREDMPGYRAVGPGRDPSSPRTQRGGGPRRMPHTLRPADDRRRRDATGIGPGRSCPTIELRHLAQHLDDAPGRGQRVEELPVVFEPLLGVG